MGVRTRMAGEVPVVELEGEFDISTAHEVDQELLRLDGQRPGTVVVDLRGLSFIDSTGLRSLLSADARCRQYGGRLVLVPGPPAVHRVFRIALLDQRPEFMENLDALGDLDALGSDGGGR
jgi:anti-sigma B factor antagonist